MACSNQSTYDIGTANRAKRYQQATIAVKALFWSVPGK